MTADELRAVLAKALHACRSRYGYAIPDETLALLPVVQRHARETAAAELRAAAQWLRKSILVDVPGPPSVWRYLDARAAALTDHGEAGPQPGAPSGTLTG